MEIRLCRLAKKPVPVKPGAMATGFSVNVAAGRRQKRPQKTYGRMKRRSGMRMKLLGILRRSLPGKLLESARET